MLPCVEQPIVKALSFLAASPLSPLSPTEAGATGTMPTRLHYLLLPLLLAAAAAVAADADMDALLAA